MRSFFVGLMLASLCLSVAVAQTSSNQPWKTENSSDGSQPGARHEAGAVSVGGRLYLLGGRGNQTVDRYDPVSDLWETVASMPLELHHFQPVGVGTKIYVIASSTCCFPTEVSISAVHVFDTATDSWSIDGSMPGTRVRGSAGAAVRNEKIYLVGGNTAGHSGGAVAWVDEFDPQTGTWTQLPDAPNARDHFGVVIIGDTLIATGGRQTSHPNTFANPVIATDIYDFNTGSWSTASGIPTARAGAMTVGFGNEVIVAGGEINTSSAALDVVESFDITTEQWRTLQPMKDGRHGGGGALLGSEFHVMAGSLNRGGAPETSNHESLTLTSGNNNDYDGDGLTNDLEAQYGTDPFDADTDDDGLDDQREIDELTNPLLADSDDDGLTDFEELETHQTDPLKADSDSDGINDILEITIYNSNPLVQDSDADGLSDGDEVLAGSALDDSDSDDDGLTDGLEVTEYQSDPTNPDSDGDGLQDGDEVSVHMTNPVLADTDGDGIPDGIDDSPLGGSSKGKSGNFDAALCLVVLILLMLRSAAITRQFPACKREIYNKTLK